MGRSGFLARFTHSATLRALSAGLLGACLLWAGSCGQGGAKLTVMQNPGLLQLVTKAQQAPLTTAHLGLRTLHVYVHAANQGAHHLVTVEQIATDGQGGYSLVAQSAAGDLPMDPTDFLALHADNAAFYQRFRDFMVRDLELFLENYELTGMPVATTVAGRSCVQFGCQRGSGAQTAQGGVFTVSVDAETGFVLAYEERDVSGQLVASMQYDTVDFAPNLEGLVFKTVPPDQVLNLAGNPADQLGFQPYQPKQVPQGYEFSLARVLSEGPQRHWACFEYTDGVEKLFFLHGGAAPKMLAGPAAWTPQFFQEYSPYRMYVTHVGPWTIVQGVWQGQYVVAVGKQPQHEMLELVESALP
jgi:hypothetical protein